MMLSYLYLATNERWCRERDGNHGTRGTWNKAEYETHGTRYTRNTEHTRHTRKDDLRSGSKSNRVAILGQPQDRHYKLKTSSIVDVRGRRYPLVPTPNSVEKKPPTRKRQRKNMHRLSSHLGFESYPFLCRAYSVSGRGKPAALTGRRMRIEFPASSSRGMSQADASSFHCARRSTFDTSSGGTKFVMTTFEGRKRIDGRWFSFVGNIVACVGAFQERVLVNARWVSFVRISVECACV